MQKNVDPMTDAAISKATTQLIGTAADLDVEVACGAAGGMAYQFRAFNKQKEPEDFQTSMVGGSLVRSFQVRLDGGKPVNELAFAHGFTNQVLLGTPDAKQIAAAGQVVIRTALQHSVETYTLDQSSPDFRAAVQSCIAPSASASNTSLPVAASTVPHAPSTNAPGVADDIPLSNRSDAELGIVPTDEIPVSNSD